VLGSCGPVAVMLAGGFAGNFSLAYLSKESICRTCHPQKFDLASEMAGGRNCGMIMAC
jgi:hypothetical protein